MVDMRACTQQSSWGGHLHFNELPQLNSNGCHEHTDCRHRNWRNWLLLIGNAPGSIWLKGLKSGNFSLYAFSTAYSATKNLILLFEDFREQAVYKIISTEQQQKYFRCLVMVLSLLASKLLGGLRTASRSGKDRKQRELNRTGRLWRIQDGDKTHFISSKASMRKKKIWGN